MAPSAPTCVTRRRMPRSASGMASGRVVTKAAVRDRTDDGLSECGRVQDDVHTFGMQGADGLGQVPAAGYVRVGAGDLGGELSLGGQVAGDDHESPALGELHGVAADGSFRAGDENRLSAAR
jgi:hypothetical protein